MIQLSFPLSSFLLLVVFSFPSSLPPVFQNKVSHLTESFREPEVRLQLGSLFWKQWRVLPDPLGSGFEEGRNWGSEALSYLPKVTQLKTSGAEIWPTCFWGQTHFLPKWENSENLALEMDNGRPGLPQLCDVRQITPPTIGFYIQVSRISLEGWQAGPGSSAPRPAGFRQEPGEEVILRWPHTSWALSDLYHPQ